jgi:mortality factor 4-like protein 1
MQVVALPAVAPVNKLLQMYVDDEKPKRTNAAELDVLEEVVAGLKEYFEKGIGKILLYAHERDQYRFYREKLAKGEPGFENLTWSDLYGAEHMARLLCRTPLPKFLRCKYISVTDPLTTSPTLAAIMPELLAQTNMNQQAINRVREELSKFSLWMTRNAEKLFAPKHSAPANTFMWDIPGRKPQGTATSGLITVEKEQMARSLNPADEMMSEEMLSERPLGSDEEADEEDGDEEDEEGEDEEEGEEGDEEEGEEGEEEEEEEEEESS